MKSMLDNLNDAQREAVTHIDGPLLILAGAGSGKTKTLTTRLAYLIGEVGIDPINTLTLTFTNKAASEMKSRALSILGSNINSMPLLCTFHKFGLIFLKFNIQKLGRDNSFVIIDTDDRKKLLRTIFKDLNIDLNLSFVSSEISKYKNSLLEPDEVIEKAELSDYKKVAKIYQEYQERLKDDNLVDFDDLLVLPYKILDMDKQLCKEWSNRYQYIMVDEYQDTNELQFRLLEKLSSEHNNLCVVGDDDQSIYGWRGANIRNILEFHEKFDNTKIVKLETNYRSTEPILEASNRLIEHNSRRLGKSLKSHRGSGSDVKIMHSLDEVQETQKIAKEIKRLLDEGVDANEIAVLYRINALSRALEEGFSKEHISFKLVGGIRFYERAEIKDIIHYFRTVSNPNNDFSLTRIINRPKRGIGNTSLNKLKELAFSKGLSIYETIVNTPIEELESSTSKRVAKSLKSFVDDIDELKEASKKSLDTFIDFFENKIGLKEYYSSMADGYDRILNINEFYGYMRDYISNNPSSTLDEFLNDISLQNEQDQVDERAINIMSIHASKGLEFEHLFVIGMEEEFFPLLGDNCDIEEERRLGYVAITRAKSDLTLSYCDSRFYKGRRKLLRRSRFLSEAGLIKSSSSLKMSKSSEYKKGDLVNHKIFGIGRVQAVTKSGKEYKLLINFGSTKKEILSSFVKPII